jgi:hypothetical protein
LQYAYRTGWRWKILVDEEEEWEEDTEDEEWEEEEW